MCKTEIKTNKLAKIKTYYFYDKRGRRKNISDNFEIAKDKWLNSIAYKKSSLYGEFITNETYHVITVIVAFYNDNDNSITIVNRDNL